ncbi:MAG: hypothetical protein ACJAR3_002967 [Roseivirga sp.]
MLSRHLPLFFVNLEIVLASVWAGLFGQNGKWSPACRFYIPGTPYVLMVVSQ